MQIVKVGIVGIGYLGRFHVDKYYRIKDVKIAGISDITDTYLSEVASKVGTKIYKDYRDLAGKVDAVSVVTPTPSHYQISKFFLENGIHVLVEKPITISIQEAEDLISIAENRCLILQVGHIERFNPSFTELQKYIDCPRVVEAHRLSQIKERSLSSSVILDLMVHDVDLISEIINSEVADIEGYGNSVITNSIDVAYSRILFENGCTACITASRVSRSEVRKLRVFQNGETYTIDFMNKTLIKSVPTKRSITVKRFDPTDMLELEIRSFINSIQNNLEPVVSGIDALRALKLTKTIEDKIINYRGAGVLSGIILSG